MQTEKCLHDPVFQLNLLLWMVKDQPSENYRIRPIFRELGFNFLYIENPFPFPETLINAIKESEIDIVQRPEPELLLKDEKNNKALYFEAKKQSFSSNSNASRQALAHLIATGPIFSEVLAPLRSCLLCYVIPEEYREKMSECLVELSESLTENNFHPGKFSMHGLSYHDEKIFYSFDAEFEKFTKFTENECVLMENVTDETDPSPLLLVFSDEDCSNKDDRDFYRRIIIEQVRANLLCELHSLSVDSPYEMTADKLLEKTSGGVFGFLGRQRQRSLSKLINKKILIKIAEEWTDKQTGIRMSNDKLTLHWQTREEKESFLQWLESRNTNFDSSRLLEDTQMDINEIQQAP